MQLILALILFVLIVFWIHQFVAMMLIQDRHFPGKFDKILWFIAFFFLPPVAPYAFFLFKSSVLADIQNKK